MFVPVVYVPRYNVINYSSCHRLSEEEYKKFEHNRELSKFREEQRLNVRALYDVTTHSGTPNHDSEW